MSGPIHITGGAWITAAGTGRLGDPLRLSPGRPLIPSSKEIFTGRVARFGRYDEATKLGCACVALTLRDAGLYDAPAPRPIGMVSSSRLECLETDLAFYQTALEEGGSLASPSIFPYTLPGAMQGECAVNFKLTGPTLCVGEEGGRGLAALRTAERILATGAAEVMLAGWLDAFADGQMAERLAPDFVSGAAFVVLEAAPRALARSQPGRPLELGGLQSIFELFPLPQNTPVR